MVISRKYLNTHLLTPRKSAHRLNPALLHRRRTGSRQGSSPVTGPGPFARAGRGGGSLHQDLRGFYVAPFFLFLLSHSRASAPDCAEAGPPTVCAAGAGPAVPFPAGKERATWTRAPGPWAEVRRATAAPGSPQQSKAPAWPRGQTRSPTRRGAARDGRREGVSFTRQGSHRCTFPTCYRKAVAERPSPRAAPAGRKWPSGEAGHRSPAPQDGLRGHGAAGPAGSPPLFGHQRGTGWPELAEGALRDGTAGSEAQLESRGRA